ncbi:hypothetical protein M3Y97_00332800 [Aphelenchoides bicaudatus]|nr:hypothetical protein M3Y97_00332800 [Aphelenchoides bicaudatus]
MTNRSNFAAAEGPPYKRRRTNFNRKSPKPAQESSVQASSESLINPNARREKKPGSSLRKKEAEQQRGVKREDALQTDRCKNFMEDGWTPDFRSTYPLSKALERRRVLVDYIHLVKRINIRKDRIEAPQKRPSVLQPQTIEELEKEINKCTQELDMLTHKRDENQEAKKNLMAKYKALYREEDEERKKQQQEQKAKATQLENIFTLISAGIIPPELLQSLQQPTSATNNIPASGALTNSILQSVQQNLLNSSAPNASSLEQYFNTLAQQNQLNTASVNASGAKPQIGSNAAINHSSVENRVQPPAQKQQINSIVTTTQNRPPASITQPHSAQQNLLNPSSSAAASLNLFHNLSSAQNPFSLAGQQTSGLLTQQAQGGLVSSQAQNIHNANLRDQASVLSAQHLLQQSSSQQQQNRASPNVQAANLLQQQANPFLASSNAALASVQQQQARPQSAAQSQSQLELQNMINQWSASQNLQNLASLLPNGFNNPQTAQILASLQQQQHLASQQLTNQALQQSIFAKVQQAQAQQAAQQQAAQKQNLLSTGLLNAASRQSPLASNSFASQPQQNQMTRKTGAASLTTSQQQQNQLAQNRMLQLPTHQSIASANLTGRSATPQFAMPNLPNQFTAKGTSTTCAIYSSAYEFWRAVGDHLYN